MKNNMKKEIKSRLLSIAFVFIFLVVGTIFVYYPNKNELLSSFAFLQTNEKFYMEDVTSGIRLAEAFPVIDEEGMENEPYIFKIVNDTNKAINYQLTFTNNIEKIKSQEAEPLANKYLRYSLDLEKANSLSDSGLIKTGTIPANTEITLDFRIWLAEDCDEGAMGKAFIGTIELKKVENSI